MQSNGLIPLGRAAAVARSSRRTAVVRPARGAAPATLARGVAVAALAALLVAGCGSSGGGSGAGSGGAGEGGGGSEASKGPPQVIAGTGPSCLPAHVDGSAQLPGTHVEVSPAPDSVTANPKTQISFLGAPASEVEEVSVSGSKTGSHEGRLESYSQGDGASFVPSKPFATGETVSVTAKIGGAPERYSFTVDTPFPTSKVPPFGNPTAKPGEYQSFDTAPGMQAPVLSVTTPDGDPSAGDIFTSNGPGPGRYGALIYAPDGRLIWFDQLSGEEVADDVNVQEYEGEPDLTMWQGRVPNLGFGEGEDLILNDHYEVLARDRGGNGLHPDLHDFQLAGHDVAYNTAFNAIRCNLSSVEGGPKNSVILDAAVQEVDLKTGLVRWEWHALDHVAAEESETSPPETRAWDWFHINSIDPQSNGDVFISSRGTWAGYQIQEGTGKILWRLGGLKSSFEMGPGTQTHWQHDGRILENGEVTFFDDGANPPKEKESRGVKIRLDFETHEASLAADYRHTPPLLAASQGNMQTLPDGNVLLGYGGVPQITEYGPSGETLFDAHLPYDYIFYRAYRHPWHAQPTPPPAIAANLNNTGEETIVHASWNGATDVASWRVLAGSRPNSLAPVSTFADTGFESSTDLTRSYEPSKADKEYKDYTYVQVQALSASGSVLGTSRAVKPVAFEESLEGEGGGG